VFKQDGVLDIRLRVLEPVHPDSVGGDAQALAGRVQAAMIAALAEMRADRSGPRAVAPR